MFDLFSSVPSISTDNLQEKLAKDKHLTILDVRTPNEYQGGHIAQAKNVPLDTIDRYDKKHNEEVYVVCHSGMRSKQASKKLADKGYNVINVKGGMSSWNGPVEGGK
ncbi:MAG TPA: rhodanese-like domain-containing protein [Alloiococcus sp.]|nr:rhodanese-like domain-containing protein [Alloiococcus sp.]